MMQNYSKIISININTYLSQHLLSCPLLICLYYWEHLFINPKNDNYNQYLSLSIIEHKKHEKEKQFTSPDIPNSRHTTAYWPVTRALAATFPTLSAVFHRRRRGQAGGWSVPMSPISSGVAAGSPCSWHLSYRSFHFFSCTIYFTTFVYPLSKI